MIISVNWLKKFTKINVSTNELVDLIGSRLVEVEGVEHLDKKYKDVVIAKVVHCQKLEGSDHLSVVLLDDAGANKQVERLENGLVQVVCGAPNVREGLIVAWLPPLATVPATFGTADPFVLSARKLRGVVSNGMLASAQELDLYDDHDGIIELDQTLPAGASFVDALELNDTLLNIENKSLTHRPDTFGIVGFAREVAAIQGVSFQTPAWLLSQQSIDATTNIAPPQVIIDNPDLSDRYQAVIVEGVDATKPSPLTLQTYLARVGVRPINAVVDITNYLMLTTGQPLHAFDYDKLKPLLQHDNTMHVRGGDGQESLTLLDGRTITLAKEDIVIAAGETPVALAGAMGGAATEVDNNTTTILLESATFNLYSLRATQMRHGIFSEAITRFTKGQPAALTQPVLTQAIAMLKELAGATAVSAIAQDYPGQKQPSAITFTVQQCRDILGEELSAASIVKTLQNIEWQVKADDDTITVTPPYWRQDIAIIEDVIEEIGRINGYDHIPLTLPKRPFDVVQSSSLDQFKDKIRHHLATVGANEVLTYSFVHGDLLKKVQQNPANSYKIVNSISPDLQYFRQTLTPSLLSLVHKNIRAGYDEFALFEINKTHSKLFDLVDEGVPDEQHMAAFVYAAKQQSSESAFYKAKNYLQSVAKAAKKSLVYLPMQDTASDTLQPLVAPYEPKRSALVALSNGAVIGVVGEFKKEVAKNFKLPQHAAGFELLVEPLKDAPLDEAYNYTPLSKYPAVERDICFNVSAAVPYSDVFNSISQALLATNLHHSVSPIDIYHEDKTDTKNITVRITLVSYQKTLTGEEVNDVISRVANFVIQEIGAKVV